MAALTFCACAVIRELYILSDVFVRCGSVQKTLTYLRNKNRLKLFKKYCEAVWQQYEFESLADLIYDSNSNHSNCLNKVKMRRGRLPLNAGIDFAAMEATALGLEATDGHYRSSNSDSFDAVDNAGEEIEIQSDFETFGNYDDIEVIDGVEMDVALYSFSSHDERTLSFEKDDFFEVLCRPSSDPGWYKVRNSKGQLGLVPRNYVKSIDNKHDGSGDSNKNDVSLTNLFDLDLRSLSSKTSSASSWSDKSNERPTLVGKPYFYGAIKRRQCETLLNQHGNYGDFIVRESETYPNDYAISLKAPGRNKHFHVHMEKNLFCIGQRKFESMDHLIYYYLRLPICKDEEGLRLFLVRPLSQTDDSYISYQSFN